MRYDVHLGGSRVGYDGVDEFSNLHHVGAIMGPFLGVGPIRVTPRRGV